MRQAHPGRRVVVSIDGEDLTLAELALTVAAGIVVAVVGWIAVVFLIVLGTPE